ncbi:tRNA pseudouridine(55) synthase TruB [Paucibacter sp. KCTC 42545]|uniref:tRNA pseudouridine(55) synthase TruB n=1 Tax=Paucibacter sp. KCTC 42545 TaxID=1768242 RepID=UPI000733BE3D|nr:tRNA pseudouridine(55) synthase TruB [Paucibacter sp. KCTC 42545]ALT77244.1 tRNA pseudouridine synthase B [Paucibacter sp. KCTC 42545]
MSAARPPRIKTVRRPIHGVLLLDKPLGWTSNDALQKAKWLLRAEKAGHTGTLDPLATGLLPLCFGAGTKFSQVSLDADKAYQATLQLGATTTTGDLEGEVLEERPVSVSREQIEAACATLRGEIDQVPPMYSALKFEGRPLYEYARAGIQIERPSRRVTIHALDIIDWQDELSQLTVAVRCSKGTYVRTLAEDLGALLGCGAHLTALRRTASGPVRVEDAISLDALAELTEAEREALLRPPDSLLADWPEVRLGADEAARFLTGLRRRLNAPDQPHVRVYGPEPQAFLGGAHIKAGELIPDRLLSPQEVSSLLGV